ncbi:hypothetical protein ACJA25_01600 [Mycoplasmopsis hyopharyngis]|uniref:hypothetical protein n=1 Tax=Mycoplasmopsis hyopharyngis TaxID=29558 RepID=UPI0038734409
MISENVKQIFENSINKGKLNHCYLIKSSSGIDLDDVLLYILNKINKSKAKTLKEIQENYFNIKILSSEDQSLAKDNVNEVFTESSYTSINKSDKKIIVLKNIEDGNINMLNSILKTIEEPTNDTFFILTTNNENKVLKTIKSRSLIINVFKVDNDHIINEFKENDFSSFYSHLFAYVYQDYKKALKEIPENYSELYKNLIATLIKSFNKPQLIYLFLSKYNDKNTSKEFVFLIRTLIFLLNTPFKKLPEKLSSNESINQLISTLKNKNYDFSNFTIAFGQFLNRLEANCLFNLQAENLLITLMETYHG